MKLKIESRAYRWLTYIVISVFFITSCIRNNPLAMLGWCGAGLFYFKTHLLELIITLREDIDKNEEGNSKENS